MTCATSLCHPGKRPLDTVVSPCGIDAPPGGTGGERGAAGGPGGPVVCGLAWRWTQPPIVGAEIPAGSRLPAHMEAISERPGRRSWGP